MFLPLPSGLHRRDGTACAPDDDLGEAYPASWTTGMTRIPGTAQLLVTYIDVCVEQRDFLVARMGTAEYTPATNTLSASTTLFAASSADDELPETLWLGSPLFADGHLYLFASACRRWDVGVCANGDVYLARVPTTQRDEPSAYRFRRHGGWVRDPESTTGIVPGATPAGVHVDDFAGVDRHLVLIETTSVAGTYRVWEARHPTGPWTPRRGARRLPGCQTPPGTADFCRAVVGQPELSTVTELAITYYSVEHQHVLMMTSPWGSPRATGPIDDSG